MASALSPLMALLNKPPAARDQAAIRALLTTQPALANRPLNSNAPGSLPLSLTLTTADIATSALLVEFGAKADRQPLAEAGSSNHLDIVTWVYSSGLDTDVTTDPDGLATAVINGTWNTDDTVLPVLDYLVQKGLVLLPDPLLGAVQRYPGVVKFAVAKGFLTPVVFTGSRLRDGRTLQQYTQLNELRNPFTYALLPDGSNGLFVAIDGAPASGPAPPALTAAVGAAATSGTLDAPVPGGGASPLFFALCRGSVTAATALVAAGADVLFRAPSGETCVGAACRSQQSAALNYIVGSISTKHGSAAALAAINAVYTSSRGQPRTALVNAILSFAPTGLFAALMAVNADPTLAVQGVPTPAWLGYAVQGASGRLTTPTFNASAVFAILAAGNASGQKPTLDDYVPVLRMSVRAFNAKNGITL